MQKGDEKMKKLIFVIVLLFSIVYIYHNSHEAPEEVIAKLYSGELKSAEEIEQYVNFDFDSETTSDKTNQYGFTDTDNKPKFDYINYYAFGYNGREDYKNKEIESLLAIDHSEGIKVKKLFEEESLDENLYEVRGTVYLKGKENKFVNVNEVLRVGKRNNKYVVEDYSPNLVYSGHPRLGELHRAKVSSDDENLTLYINIIPYYRGNSIAFSIQFLSFTNEELVISDWPDCATVTWDGKTERLRNVIYIDGSDVRENMSGREAMLRYSSSVVFYFDKPISPREAEEKIRKSEFKINFVRRGKNGLPVTNEPNHTLRFTLP